MKLLLFRSSVHKYPKWHSVYLYKGLVINYVILSWAALCCVNIVKKKARKTEWVKPKRKPTKSEERKMFGKALKMMLKLCMDNHTYQFENIIRVQNKGGPIGLKLTGGDCRLCDDWLGPKVTYQIKELWNSPRGIHKIQGWHNNCYREFGKRKCIGKWQNCDEKMKSDEKKSDSKVTIGIIQELAMSINAMIKLTIETPCSFKTTVKWTELTLNFI